MAEAQYYFEKLTKDNGLSDNQVTCFLKDKTGFLWIGTKNGLNRYDGHSFKVFKPSSKNSLSNEVINDIVQDSSGRIWVATMNGLNIYDPKHNQWEVMMPTGMDNTGLPSYFIWDMFVDKQNRIWAVSDVWELSVFDPVTRKFNYYDWPSVHQQKIFDNTGRYRSIQRIEFKNDTEWWLGTTIGLFSLNSRSGNFRFHGSGYNENAKDLKYDPQTKTVFLVTETGKLFAYQEEKDLYEELKPEPEAYPAVRVNKNKNRNDWLLMPHPDGMLEINRATRKATIIMHRPALSSSLLPGGSNSIYTDNTGKVWVGMHNGVNSYSSRNQTADFIPLTISSDRESVDGMSAAIYDDVDGLYFITSNRSKEVFIIDDRLGTISSLTSANGKPFSPCLNICTDLKKNIWLLTETHVYRYDRSARKFNLFPTPNNGNDVSFNDLLEDKQGNYWFGTWLDGVYQYKTKEKTFHRYGFTDSFSAKSITSLMNDPVDNAIWLGSFNTGVYRYDLEKNVFTNYSETPANPEYMQLNLIKDIETGVEGKVWFTTYGSGLYVYSRGQSHEKSFTHITGKQGLSNSSYFAMTADDKNRLWLLSAKGLSVIDSSGRFLYDAAKHPAISFGNYVSAPNSPKRISFNASKNEILVAVAGGLLLYYPDKTIPSPGFPVVFTDISVDGHSVINDSSYQDKKKIEIPYRSNSLSFQFAALNYENRNIQYEYKLHEKDAEWKPVGSSNTVNFPDLASGRYTFIVRAKTADGNYSTSTAFFSFRIKPPFWKTWWFYLLVSWLIATIVYLIYQYQLNKKLEVERLRLRISRDLHDDIGSALTSINVLSKVAMSKGGDSEVSGYLSRIKDSTSLTMESMSDIVWAINPKNDKLEALMSRIKEFAADICEAQGIDLDFKLPPELEKISLDLAKRKNLFLVFKEAINNAIKYSHCTLLRVSFERTGNRLRMIIQDNGQGFDKATVVRGNGLYNMNERAVECHGSLQVETVLQKGTSIVFEIPITRFGVSVSG